MYLYFYYSSSIKIQYDVVRTFIKEIPLQRKTGNFRFTETQQSRYVSQ